MDTNDVSKLIEQVDAECAYIPQKYLYNLDFCMNPEIQTVDNQVFFIYEEKLLFSSKADASVQLCFCYVTYVCLTDKKYPNKKEVYYQESLFSNKRYRLNDADEQMMLEKYGKHDFMKKGDLQDYLDAVMDVLSSILELSEEQVLHFSLKPDKKESYYYASLNEIADLKLLMTIHPRPDTIYFHPDSKLVSMGNVNLWLEHLKLLLKYFKKKYKLVDEVMDSLKNSIGLRLETTE